MFLFDTTTPVIFDLHFCKLLTTVIVEGISSFSNLNKVAFNFICKYAPVAKQGVGESEERRSWAQVLGEHQHTLQPFKTRFKAEI